MSAIPEKFHDTQFTSERQVFYILLIIVSGLLIFYNRQKKSKLVRLGDKMPGPKALPIFGNALMVLGKSPSDIVKDSLEYAEKYGNVVRGWLGPKLFVFLMDPADAEPILNSHVHIDKSTEYDFFKPWLGEGLLISTGKKWQSHRKIIAPTFHINILKSFIGVFNQNSQNVVEKMRHEIGETFDVHDYMSGVTVDILLETVMGITRQKQDESGFDYAMAVMKMCDILHQRHYKWWLRPECIFKFSSLSKKQAELLNIIHGLTNQVIKSKKEEYNLNKAKGIIRPTIEELTRESNGCSDNESENNTKNTENLFSGYRDDLDFIDENDVGEKKRLAFLDLMIESAQNGANDITDHEIKEEVDTIMFEGHDATAAASSFVLCLLGVHQDIQAQAYDELYEIFGDSDREATFNDTVQMKYLERVILETLRLFPPVPVIARLLKHDVQISTNDYIIPAGATVVIGPYKIHRNPKYYKYPHVFNPDNFLPENTQNRNYYSFIPFSAGPRSCVGRKYAILKLKVLLSTILRNYKITSDIPEEKYELLGDIILKRADGFRLKIEPRQRTPKSNQ
ncbi:hypothetical protein evm_006393 [Chilo suppressalis]|nr:hypothetical protein evm_006393 [Chilo suppressalis]